jgi:hypothetical protein
VPACSQKPDREAGVWYQAPMESSGLVAERSVDIDRDHASRRRPSAEDIAWVGLWPASLALIAAILWLAPPLSDLYPERAHELFPAWQPQVNPEPLEATRVLLALAVPFGLVGFVLLGSAARGDRRFDTFVIALQIAAIALIVWGVAEQVNGPFPLVPADYFQPLLLSAPILTAGVVVGVALTLVLLAARRFPHLDPYVSMPSRWRGAAIAAAVVLTALWLLPAVVTDHTVGASGPIASAHIPVQGADYFAVVNGRTPFVDYVPQYTHLLPLALAPLLSLFDMSLTSFSVSMSALSLVALLALFGALLEVTQRPVAALALYVPVLAFALFPWSVDGLQREFNALYYGFFPGRYVGPFVVGWLCALLVRRRRLPAWLLFFIAGLAALNNGEFGVPSAIAAFGGLVLGSDRAWPMVQTVRALLGQAIIGLVGALALVTVVTIVRAGELPDLVSLAYYSDLFAREAFGLTPMPTLGLHIALYVTFVAAILVAAVRYAQARDNSTLTAMLAYAGIFGLLTSLYFAGRSLPWQLMLLFPAWGLALALLAWIAARSLSSVRSTRAPLARALLPSLAALCGFGVMVAAIATFPPPWTQVERLSQSGAAVYDVPEVQRLVDERTDPGEAILLFGTLTDHRIAERAGVLNVSPWNYWLSLFSEREVRRALDALEDGQGSKVVLNQGTDRLGLGLLEDRGPVPVLLRARGYKRVVWDPDSQLAIYER